MQRVLTTPKEIKFNKKERKRKKYVYKEKKKKKRMSEKNKSNSSSNFSLLWCKISAVSILLPQEFGTDITILAEQY